MDEIDWNRRQDRDVKALIVKTYDAMTRRIARKAIRQFAKDWPVDEHVIYSGAFVGLLQAINKYDPAMGIKFSTFAPHRIRGAILDSLRDADRLSRLHRRTMTSRNRAADHLRQSLSKEPNDDEIQHAIQCTGFPAAKIKIYGDITDSAAALDVTDLMREDSLRFLTRGLNPKQREIIRLYYFEGMIMKDVGRSLGLSESRVSQMHTEILTLLRKRGREDFDVA